MAQALSWALPHTDCGMSGYSPRTGFIDGRPPSRSGLSSCDSTRFDILIHAEQIARIVLRFDRSEPRVIVTVCRLETPFGLIIHHEVHVSATKVERMNGFPIRTSP